MIYAQNALKYCRCRVLAGFWCDFTKSLFLGHFIELCRHQLCFKKDELFSYGGIKLICLISQTSTIDLAVHNLVHNCGKVTKPLGVYAQIVSTLKTYR